jgi:hypothetical protein
MENKHNKQIKTFYTEKQVCFDSIQDRSFSQSPLKPFLLMNRIKNSEFNNAFDIVDDFSPFKREDFLTAHTEAYVDNVFNKTGNYRSNSLPWSKNLVESLTYTNASLYTAMRHAYTNPTDLCFAPVSGMHHAMPHSGSGFCTFSGQVISSIKLYEEFGAVGAWFDLDGHFGNSIEDTRLFNPLVDKAIPKHCNVNPTGYEDDYVSNFEKQLEFIGEKIKRGEVHYVVFAHGADSHIDDDLGGSCNTKNWLKCAKLFAEWVNSISQEIGSPLPVTLTLFGGYRKANYNAVLDLHIRSLKICWEIIERKKEGSAAA